jgi:hypothetical protein
MKRAYGKSFTRRHAVKIAGIGLMGATSGASADPQGETMISQASITPGDGDKNACVFGGAGLPSKMGGSVHDQTAYSFTSFQ